MAKLLTMFLVLLALQASMFLYAGKQDDTTLWNFIMNFDQWSTLEFITALTTVTAIGFLGVAAGSIFGFKTDFLILAPLIAGLISIGVVFQSFAIFLRGELVSIFFNSTCSTASVGDCPGANFLVAIIVGPWALYYVWTVIEWWRGKDF